MANYPRLQTHRGIEEITFLCALSFVKLISAHAYTGAGGEYLHTLVYLRFLCVGMHDLQRTHKAEQG